METNVLYYGDNLRILRDHIPTHSVDLIYLDPPFNSKKEYNLLFTEPTGGASRAQVTAFEDSWRWDESACLAYAQIIERAPAQVSSLISALCSALGRNDLTAYLVMMTVRLIELERVLKDTGSIYLHCDPAASHYLKVVLDAIFGPRSFRREVIWRSGWVSGFKAAAKNWVRNHDVLLYYVKSLNDVTFNKQYAPHPPGYQRRGGGENPAGVALDDVWTDIYSPWIMSFSQEKLGYLTQKPIALLERIIAASSNPNDVVLDPFCGCGTAVHAAQKLGRRWIGIDITHLAVALMRSRMERAFPGLSFTVHGEPADIESARALFEMDAHQFQWWAVSLLRGQPTQPEKKGGDRGVDGRLVFVDQPDGTVKRVVISVKGGTTGPSHVRDLHGVCDREDALGIFVCLQEPTREMSAAAAAAGTYTSPLYQRTLQKIQIVTIRELFANQNDPRAALRLPMTQPFLPTARRESVGVQTELGIP